MISRIKVLAQLDITERRRPQDGRIHWERPGGVSLDLRVSIMPSIFGEDAVLRLLDKAQLRHTEESMSLDVLGFDSPVASIIRGLATRPHGMLLVTGPTGSGKTTTVYAALTEANNGLEKIVTIEDPVEYELPGVLQIPVNEQKGCAQGVTLVTLAFLSRPMIHLPPLGMTGGQYSLVVVVLLPLPLLTQICVGSPY